MKFTFLGTGTSYGVPMIGCACEVCTSPDPKNKRLRPALLIEHDGKNILVDTPPDLRTQCLTFGVTQVDAVLYTHAHADHVNGIDDLRRFTDLQEGYITLYGNEQTVEALHVRFPYCFVEDRMGFGLPKLRTKVIKEPFELFGLRITPMTVMHAKLPVSAFKFEDEQGRKVSYVTDCNFIPNETLAQLHDLDVLILDALREKPHVSHFSIHEAVAIAQTLKPNRTYFVHMSHRLEHHATNAQLPDGMQLAYDGLVLEI